MDINNTDLPLNNGEESVSNVIKVNIEEQMKTAYIDYSMSVIVGRALPDVRDGLKPVHRRVLFAMHELGNTHNKAYKKCARIVGEVLGKYHPHGDTAVYDTMVRMAQNWNMRYTMVDGQGNYGSPDSDGPAAMRYTEARMTRYAEALLEDLEKETVDFSPNFDDSLEEPTVLPARVPQLLVNGSSGIAVGMATNMMPHNLSEVIDGCVAYIENNDITIDELMVHVKAPDFPTGAMIYGTEGIKIAMHTGRGRVVLRGHTTVETSRTGKESIIITSVPYQVDRDALTAKIGMLVNTKVIDGVTHVGNESSKEGTRIVVELRKDAVAQILINQLYKFTELQSSYGINNVALVNGRPKILNLKDLIREFIAFRLVVVTRRTEYELREARKRAHIIEGYIIALNNLDAVIKLIRESKNPDAAKTGLIQDFAMSDIQAKAVLEMRLQRLTGMEIDKIREEFNLLMITIEDLQAILASEPRRFEIIKAELEEVKKKFGDARRSMIVPADDDENILDFIKEEDAVITISHLGYMKRTTQADYRAQRRGGRGANGGRTREEDFIEHLFIASTHHTLLFFTEKGRCYWLPVHRIPEADRTAKGRAVQNLIQLPQDDKIRAIIDVPQLDNTEFVEQHSVVLCTKKGIIKKTSLKDFSRPRANGVNAITIVEGDELLDVSLTDGNSYVMMAVKSGRAISFPEDKVRTTGRGAIGVYGIDMEEGKDEVVGMICVSKEALTKQILVVSENGMGKRTPFLEPAGEDAKEGDSAIVKLLNAEGKEELYALSYRITNRGGKGVKTINVTEKTGGLVGFLAVNPTDDLMITCKSGTTIRMSVTAIREAGRATQGVRLINLDEGDSIAAIARISEQEEEEMFDEEGNPISESAAEIVGMETLPTGAMPTEGGAGDTDTTDKEDAPETNDAGAFEES